MPEMEPIAEDWQIALAVVAHPDDMAYGPASAVARWTRQANEVAYVVVTAGEAGISSMPPETVGPLRRAEQEASCAAMVAFNGSPRATHGVDVTGYIESGIESLLCHRTYLENLEETPHVDEFLRGSAASIERLGVELAAAFEVVTP